MLTQIEQHVVDFVKKLRHEKNLTQADIGFIIGADYSFIQKVESQKSRAKYNLKHINLIADHFGISPQEFLPERAYKSE